MTADTVLAEETKHELFGGTAQVVDDEGDTIEVGNGHSGAVGKTMLRRCDECHAVSMYGDRLKLLKGRCVLEEADLDFAVEHHARDLIQPRALHAHLDVRKELKEVQDRIRQQVERRRFMCGDRESARLKILELKNGACRFVAQFQHALGVVFE